MKRSPPSVTQQDEEKEAEDAGESAVDSNQQGGGGVTGLVTVTGCSSCGEISICLQGLKWFYSKYQWEKSAVPSEAPTSDRDTRRLVDLLSPFPLNATSWIL